MALATEFLGGGEIGEDPDGDVGRLPYVGGEDRGEEGKARANNDGDTAFEGGSERFQGGGNVDDFRRVFVAVGGGPQVDEGARVEEPAGVGSDECDRLNKVVGRQCTDSGNADVIAWRWYVVRKAHGC